MAEPFIEPESVSAWDETPDAALGSLVFDPDPGVSEEAGALLTIAGLESFE